MQRDDLRPWMLIAIAVILLVLELLEGLWPLYPRVVFGSMW